MISNDKDPLALPVIKQEFDNDLNTPLEGWSPLTGSTATNSSLPLSPTTTQSVENLFSPTTTISNNSSPTTVSPLPNLITTYPSVTSVHKRPKIDHQMKKLVRNNNNKRPLISNRNKFAQNDSIFQNNYNNNSEMFLNFEFQLKTQKQLKELTEMLTETKNANQKLEEQFVELKLDFFEFKTNANIKFDKLDKLDKLEAENDKLHDELNQLKESQHGSEKSTEILSVNQSSDSNLDQVMNPEKELIYDDEENLEQGLDDDLVIESIDPSPKSRQQKSNLIVSKSPRGSKIQNLTKRKQSQPNRIVKKCKKTVDDNEVNEDINHKNVEKIKVLHLNCTQPNCSAKLNTLKHLQKHLQTEHELLPFRCFAQNCNFRFDHTSQMAAHLKLRHSMPTTFVCPVCHKEKPSQNRTYVHWNRCHLSGQFQCNLNECNQVFDNRGKLEGHQKYKHCPESELFVCKHDGCSLTIPTKRRFELHQLVHLNSKPFHCKWPHCSHRTIRRADLVNHIRIQHFGLPSTKKEQKEKNIVEERDPHDYVEVVEDEIA